MKSKFISSIAGFVLRRLGGGISVDFLGRGRANIFACVLGVVAGVVALGWIIGVVLRGRGSELDGFFWMLEDLKI